MILNKKLKILKNKKKLKKDFGIVFKKNNEFNKKINQYQMQETLHIKIQQMLEI